MRQVEEAGLRVGTGERRTADRNEVVSNLFFAHHRRLVGLAALLVTDQQIAEDVVQEAFAGLYRRWRQLRDPNAAVGYLNRAVVNGSRASLRRKRRAGVAMLRLAPRHEERESAEHDALDHQQADRLWAAVIALPMRQRQVLVLRYYLSSKPSCRPCRSGPPRHHASSVSATGDRLRDCAVKEAGRSQGHAGECFGVGQDRDGLFERPQILRGDDNGRACHAP